MNWEDSDLPRKIETRMVPEEGVTIDGVWFPLNLLGELAEQHRYDSEFGEAFISTSPEQERVLLAHNLAVKETRGGLHSSEPAQLHEFLDELEKA